MATVWSMYRNPMLYVHGFVVFCLIISICDYRFMYISHHKHLIPRRAYDTRDL